MGDVIHMSFPQESRRSEKRQAEAGVLRSLIEGRTIEFRTGESARVAARLDDAIARFAVSQGLALRSVCQSIWPGEENPVKRRPELRAVKKPMKLLQYVDRIAHAVGAASDELLLEAFRDTRFEEEANSRLSGKAAPPDLDQCWRVLSDSIHALASEIARTEKLDEHQLLASTTRGRYDLAEDGMFRYPGTVILNPLANGSAYYAEYPLIPSALLFSEMIADPVACILAVDAIGYRDEVLVTVEREVRLAIGPADNHKEPKPLFEFRTVLKLEGRGEKEIRLRRPWHDLASREVIVDIDGAWHDGTIALPEGFSAPLEFGVQYEHHDIAWRPVTAASCRDQLDRDPLWASMRPPSANWDVDPLCPPYTIGTLIESILLGDEAVGLIADLRADAKRVSELLRSWHTQQTGIAVATHEEARARWRNWS